MPAFKATIGIWPLLFVVLALGLAGCSLDDERVSAASPTHTTPPAPAFATSTFGLPTPLVATAGSRPFVANPTTLSVSTTSLPSITTTSKATLAIKTRPAAPTKPIGASPNLSITIGPPVYRPEDVAANVADGLNKQIETRATGMPQNLEQVKSKLKSLLLEIKATGPDEPIEAADLEAEGHLDIIATASQNWTAQPVQVADPGFVLVLHQVNGAWTGLVYRKPPEAGLQTDFSHPVLLKVVNLNKSRYPQIVFSEQHCSNLSCTSAVRVLSWYGNKWYDLTPAVPEMENVKRVGFENRDNDGSLVLVISGGVTEAADAGPQRRRTEIYRYDATSTAFRLSETTFEASNYLYFRILDGNEALARQHYDDAIAYYIDAVYNDKLKLWATEQGNSFDGQQSERTALVAFGRFRLGIAYLLKGERQKASDIFNVALNRDGDYKLWTQAFIAPYQDHSVTATVAEGCASALKLSQQRPDLIQPLNKFGYANPLFKPEDICPPLAAK